MVASRSGGHDEAVVDDVSGLLFRSGDTAGLAAGLRRMRDPVVRQRLVDGAQKRLSHFQTPRLREQVLASLTKASAFRGRAR